MAAGACRPHSWERGCTIVSEDAKSNGAVRVGRTNPRATGGRWPAVARHCCEAGLDASLFLLPPILALVPRGAAPLVAVAGLSAAGLLAATRLDAAPRPRLAALRHPAALLAALLLWGALSAAWSIDPGRSLVLALRLSGLFAAALALAAAAGRIAAPRRLFLCLCLGTALGIALAFGDLASRGGLSQLVSIRRFIGPRLNQEAAWAAILVLPGGALLVARGRRALGAAFAIGLAATVLLLDDTSAKVALALSLPMAALIYWRRAGVARLAAGLAVLAILTAPLTLPRLAHSPALFARVDAFKDSAGHRLLIWSFAGDRIAERPFLGWGLDAARAIPGGKDEIRPGQNWLPLHTHDAALQVWLELGAPGAALYALIIGLLWIRLAAASWPRLYAAAAGGSLAAALALAQAGWGIWEEWWFATLSLALFAVLVMAPLARSGRPHLPSALLGRRGAAAAAVDVEQPLAQDDRLRGDLDQLVLDIGAWPLRRR